MNARVLSDPLYPRNPRLFSDLAFGRPDQLCRPTDRIYIWPESARIAVRGHELLGPKSRQCVRLDINIDNLAILYDPIPGEI